MIDVTYSKTQDSCGTHWYNLIVTGHAGYAEYGKDIVCSAATILIMTANEAAEEISGENMDILFSEEPGHGALTVSVRNDDLMLSEKVETIFRTVLSGYHLLNVNYPDFIRLHD